MKRLFSVFTRNWGLKLLALALALAVFYAVRGSIRAPQHEGRPFQYQYDDHAPKSVKAPAHGVHN